MEQTVSAKQQFLSENQRAGEVYGGIALGQNGEPDYHLFAQTKFIESSTFDEVRKYVEKVGGAGATRRDLALLRVNAPKPFGTKAFWSCEQRAADSAWYQDFGNVGQYSLGKGYRLCGVAVRRLAIAELETVTGDEVLSKEEICKLASSAGFMEPDAGGCGLSGNSDDDEMLYVDEYPVGESVFKLAQFVEEAHITNALNPPDGFGLLPHSISFSTEELQEMFDDQVDMELTIEQLNEQLDSAGGTSFVIGFVLGMLALGLYSAITHL